jgi:hypothetical protein
MSGKEKNWISVTIVHGGESRPFSFNIHMKIKKVVEEALKAFNLQPAPEYLYYLVYGSVNLDNYEKSLMEYNIPEGAILALARRCRVGQRQKRRWR